MPMPTMPSEVYGNLHPMSTKWPLPLAEDEKYYIFACSFEIEYQMIYIETLKHV